MGEVETFAFSPLSDEDFARLATLIESYSGIRLPESKRTMVEGRLHRRVRSLGLGNVSEYCDQIFNKGLLGAEFDHLIDAITTNKTDFFREPTHFEFLAERIIPDALMTNPQGPIRIWSAACSNGAEPYSIAMVLENHARRVKTLRYEVAGTDICTDALRTAVEGIYDEEMAAPIPAHMRRDFVMTARDPSRRLCRIVPELRQAVRFGRLNLMDPDYTMPLGFDAIFCRNVLIYFHQDVQRAVLARLVRHLRPGGFLLLGHSETLTGISQPLVSVGPTVFRKE